MMNETFDPSIYDDPNCLLGSEEADLKITKHKEQWHLDFAGDRYSIRINRPGQHTSLTITSHVPSEATINWRLSRDPLKWTFEPDRKLVTPFEDINNWARTDFIKALSTWSPDDDTHPLLVPIIKGHYTGLAFWLLLDEIRGSEKKNKLLAILCGTPLLQLKPHVEFCTAKREFAKEIFPKLQLAQRAEDRDLLWLAIEYSSFLQKNQTHWEYKTPWREFCTNLIYTFRQALNKKGFDETSTIEQLQNEGEDWRQYILSLLLQEAIQFVFENQDENLKFHCNKFLDSWDMYVDTVGHLQTHQIYYQDSKGDLRVTSKGHKKGKKITPLILASRLTEGC